MNLNPSLTYFLSVLLLILLLFAGCGEDSEEMTDPEIPEIATVKIEFTLPSPPPAIEPDGPVCKAGDILQPGDSCFYPGTDIKVFVVDDGTLRFLNVFNHSVRINFEKVTINGTLITLIAHPRHKNSWKIEKIGLPGKLDVIVSTDFIETSNNELIYNTKHEFALTQSFSQNFPIDPNDPRLAVEITNNTYHDLSVHVTFLLDGEVEVDKRELFTSGSRKGIRWTRSITNW